MQDRGTGSRRGAMSVRIVAALLVCVAIGVALQQGDDPAAAPVASETEVSASQRARSATSSEERAGRSRAEDYRALPSRSPLGAVEDSTTEEPPSLRVRVLLATDDSPVEGYVVRVFGDDVFGRYAALSDELGEAVFEGVRPGHYGLEGSARRIDVAAVGETSVELRVLPQFEVRGRVVDTSLRPVPGAEVFAVGLDLSYASAVRAARTGLDGRFRWTGYRRRICLFARAPGYAPSPVLEVSEELLVATGGELVLALRSAEVADVRGVVVSAVDATPIPGALLALRPPVAAPVAGVVEDGQFQSFPRLAPRLLTTSDALGQFAFRDVLPGSASLRIRADGYGVLDTAIELTAPRAGEFRFELAAPLAVTGDVVDERGAPIAGAVVEASSVADEFRAPQVTGADGRYRLEPVPGRRLRIVARAPGYRAARSEVAIDEGQREVEHRFELVRASSSDGLLVDDRGEVLAGWRVLVVGPGDISATTDTKGHFTLPLALPPAALVGCAPPPRPDRPIGAPQPLVRELREGSESRTVWRARAADAPRAAFYGSLRFEPPIDSPSVRLVLSAPALQFRRSVPLELIDRGGDHAFESAPWSAGTYELSLEPGEGESRVPGRFVGRFELRSGERLDLGTVAVPVAARLELRLDLPPGVPLRNVRCVLEQQPSGRQVRAGFDGSGAFQSEPLAPGLYALRLSGSGFEPVEREFQLVSGEVARERVELAAARDLVVRCDWRREESLRGRVVIEVADFDTGTVRHRAYAWANELLRHGVRIGLPDGHYRVGLSVGGAPQSLQFVPNGSSQVVLVVE